MSTKTMSFKRGSTFSLIGYAKLPTGTWTASASVGKQGQAAVVDSLTVTLTPLAQVGLKGETHAITLTKAATATALWPVTNLFCDVRFTAGSTVIHSPTFTIAVQQQITNA